MPLKAVTPERLERAAFLHDQRERLAEWVIRRRCKTCQAFLSVAWSGGSQEEGEYYVRCPTSPEHQRFERVPNYADERSWKYAMTQALRPIEGPKDIVAIPPDTVRELLFAGASAQPTTPEIQVFLQVCAGLECNPWLGQIHLVKPRQDLPAYIVVGIAHYVERASDHPAYHGHQAGVIVEQKGERILQEGEAVFPGQTLIGGWAEVWRNDRKFSYKAQATVAQYKPQGVSSQTHPWVSKTGTMIRKVALQHALKEAFPGLFSKAKEVLTATGQAEVALVETPEAMVEVENLEETPVAEEGTFREPVVASGTSTGGEQAYVPNERCFLHGIPWYQGPTHGMRHKMAASADYCSPGKAYAEKVGAARALLGITLQELNDQIVKPRYGDVVSKLNPAQFEELLADMAERVKQKDQADSTDKETGEVLQPMDADSREFFEAGGKVNLDPGMSLDLLGVESWKEWTEIGGTLEDALGKLPKVAA